MNAFQFEISLTFLIVGLLTLAFRKRRNTLVGFRIGYTYHSERVWEKVNTFTGLLFVAYSIFLLVLTFHGISILHFVVLMVVFLVALVTAGTLMAKREYELEELSEEAPEKPPATGEAHGISIGLYLLLQLAFLSFYLLLVALFWNRLPGRVAIHFSTSGQPNGYADRFWGLVGIPVLVWLIPFGLTLFAKDPGFFARVSTYPPSRRSWCEFNVIMSGILVLMFLTVLLYNVGAISANVINYAIVGFFVLIGLATYRLFVVRIDERA